MKDLKSFGILNAIPYLRCKCKVSRVKSCFLDLSFLQFCLEKYTLVLNIFIKPNVWEENSKEF